MVRRKYPHFHCFDLNASGAKAMVSRKTSFFAFQILSWACTGNDRTLWVAYWRLSGRASCRSLHRMSLTCHWFWTLSLSLSLYFSTWVRLRSVTQSVPPSRGIGLASGPGAMSPTRATVLKGHETTSHHLCAVKCRKEEQ